MRSAVVVVAAVSVATVACSQPKEREAVASNHDAASSAPTAPRVTALEAQLAGEVRTNLDSPAPTPAQRDRKKKSEDAVRALGMPVNAGLPVVEDDLAVKPRTSDEVAQRTLATMICAVKGEDPDQTLTDALVAEFGAAGWFSPEEDRFRKNPSPTQADRTKFGWRYEALHVFLWALGHTDTLNPPNDIADAGHDVRIVKKLGKDFVAKARLRPLAEVLDMADFYYRLDWATVDLRIAGKSSAAANGEIVQERHRALNWLIRYMNQDWDDVKTDT